MSFIDTKSVDTIAELKALRYQFPHAVQIEKALRRIVTDYAGKASNLKAFEAEGVLLTGESRAGKTTALEDLKMRLNDGTTIMPDGHSLRFISCKLSAKDNFKSLGLSLCDALGYPMRPTQPQARIWRMVQVQAKLQGVYGIWFDEVQHIFADKVDAVEMAGSSTTSRR